MFWDIPLERKVFWFLTVFATNVVLDVTGLAAGLTSLNFL